MSYSIIGILAIIIHLIINRDMLSNKTDNSFVPAHKEYRHYIFGMLIFCFTDALWGLMNEFHLVIPLYIVTVAFFITMMAGFLLWTRYTVAYLKNNGVFEKALKFAGIAMFGAELIILAVNFFVPIQFWFDENGVYHAGNARNITLLMQVLLFVLTSIYTFAIKAKTEIATKRLRRTVGLFGIEMAALIVLQVFYPMLPLYSVGFLISSCLLHTFVIEDEKTEYLNSLEEALRREKEQSKELGSAKKKIYTDSLTGVKNKQAYMEEVQKLDMKIRKGTLKDTGAAVFDLNGLKNVNDTRGHDTGDIYIYTASMLISEFFTHSTVYRIGGDEFVVILEGSDYADRNNLTAQFNRQVIQNLYNNKVVVAAGVAEYKPGFDRSFRTVFDRADKQMYSQKSQLKKLQKRLLGIK
ncbi:MAG: GGDEF domain-containing protein [Ruminococcus sp.]|nr:GGDEF domain-containing protein [Ruminococcus sp.]